MSALSDIKEQFETLQSAVEELGTSIEEAEEILEEGDESDALSHLNSEAASLAWGTAEALHTCIAERNTR
jgi:hypothetical protein